MSMKRAWSALIAACGVAAVVIATAAVGTSRAAQSERAGVVEAARIRKTPPAVAARGSYPREEWFVRDLYARLMRYDLAAREFYRIEAGAPTSPGDYLVIKLSAIRTEEWTGSGSLGVSASGSDVLTIHRQALCKRDDPCHAYYEVAWGRGAAGHKTSADFARWWCEPVYAVYRDAHPRHSQPYLCGRGALS